MPTGIGKREVKHGNLQVRACFESGVQTRIGIVVVLIQMRIGIVIVLIQTRIGIGTLSAPLVGGS